MARDHARHAYGPAPTLSLIQISGRLARLMEIYCNLGNVYDFVWSVESKFDVYEKESTRSFQLLGEIEEICDFEWCVKRIFMNEVEEYISFIIDMKI